jgi:hypothetical protein
MARIVAGAMMKANGSPQPVATAGKWTGFTGLTELGIATLPMTGAAAVVPFAEFC